MSWPPDPLDDDALQFTIDRLREDESQSDWLLYFACLRTDGNPEILVGYAGYKGPPQSDGTVELGYGIVGDHKRNGYATEATLGLVRNAFFECVGSPRHRRNSPYPRAIDRSLAKSGISVHR